MRKNLLGYGAMVVTALGLLACTSAVESADDAVIDTDINIPALHERLITLDTHIDIPLTYMSEINPALPTALQVDIPKLAAGQLDSGFWIVYTPQGDLTDDGYAAGLEIAQIRQNAIEQFVADNSDKVGLALTARDVSNIVRSGRHAVLIGMENAYPLGESVASVSEWAQRGVRYMGITHFGHNQFGDSSNPHPERDDGPRHQGLSELGQDLIRAMNASGVMVDVSHAGKATMMQAADLSATPIIASHSGAKAVADSARNLDDEQLRKIRSVGGVAQMVALGVYVKPLTAAQEAFRDSLRVELGLDTEEGRAAVTPEIEALYEDRIKGMWDIEPRATVSDFVDHIDHAVSVAGIDHVGIASDFDGGGGIEGWDDASETVNVTAELVKRGYSEDDIAKIWGSNLLRVMEAVEAAAK